MGMIPIESFGGSGLDIDKMVNAITRAEIAPAEQRLQKIERKSEVELTAIGKLSSMMSKLSAFIGEMSQIDNDMHWQVSSDADNRVFASFLKSETADRLSAAQQVIVQSLASRHRLITGTFSPGFKIGNGTLELKTQGGAVTISITEDMTLSAIAGAINKVATRVIGINAQLLPEGEDLTLLLSSKRYGAASEIQLQGTDSGQLLAAAFKEVQPAVDARLFVDGVAISSDTNEVQSQLLSGVKLQLLKADPSVGVTIQSYYHPEVLKHQLSLFVEGINELVKYRYIVREYPNEEGTVVQNVLRTLHNDISDLVSRQFSSSGTGLLSLAEFGVSTNKDGTLFLSEATYDKMSKHYGSDLLVWAAQEDGVFSHFTEKLEAYIDNSSVLNQRKEYFSKAYANAQQEKVSLAAKEKLIHAREMKKFQAMDSRVAKLKSLGEHMEMLNNIKRDKK